MKTDFEIVHISNIDLKITECGRLIDNKVVSINKAIVQTLNPKQICSECRIKSV